jgi:hypothetical protein
MTIKNLLPIFFALALATVYAVWFTDWFKPATVEIYSTSRNLRMNFRRGAGGGALPALIFGVNYPIRLTEIKVVPLAALATNQNALPVWHLISDSNSVPKKSFFYGERIDGMRPALKGVHAEPLNENVTYRLFITAGKFKGKHDFELK